PRGRLTRYCLLFALWTVLGLIDGVQYYIHLNKFRSLKLPLGEMMLSGLGDWYGWAFLAPLIMQFARHYPLSGRPGGRRLALHLGFAAAIICAKTLLDFGLGWLIHGDLVLRGPFLPSMLESLQ